MPFEVDNYAVPPTRPRASPRTTAPYNKNSFLKIPRCLWREACIWRYSAWNAIQLYSKHTIIMTMECMVKLKGFSRIRPNWCSKTSSNQHQAAWMASHQLEWLRGRSQFQHVTNNPLLTLQKKTDIASRTAWNQFPLKGMVLFLGQPAWCWLLRFIQLQWCRHMSISMTLYGCAGACMFTMLPLHGRIHLHGRKLYIWMCPSESTTLCLYNYIQMTWSQNFTGCCICLMTFGRMDLQNTSVVCRWKPSIGFGNAWSAN